MILAGFRLAYVLNGYAAVTEQSVNVVFYTLKTKSYE